MVPVGLVLILLPGVQGRRLLRLVDDPALPERLVSYRQRNNVLAWMAIGYCAFAFGTWAFRPSTGARLPRYGPIEYSGAREAVSGHLLLKRPFDSQEEALVRLEAEAVATILALPPERVTLVRTSAQALENSLNPVRWRREAVATWLDAVPVVVLDDRDLEQRTAELIALGFKSFDAFHVASAEACADVLITVDERLRKKAERMDPPLRVRVASRLVVAQEVLEWKT